jgi:hypothetical protein
MQVKLDIPSYSPLEGLKISWNNGYEISVSHDNGVTIIRANKEGLISLATQFLTLAQENVPVGTHVHYDDTNSLEDGSSELIVERA